MDNAFESIKYMVNFTEEKLREMALRHAATLGANDSRFLQDIFRKDLEIYTKRLRCYGFNDLGRVLDAGCGFGQWTLSLLSLGNSVTARDADNHRTAFLDSVKKSMSIDSLTIETGDLGELPHSNGSFDGVFCYGVLCRTPWKEVLAEIARVLKPGGRIYVNANGIGWYKHLWYEKPGKVADYDPAELAARTWLNTWKYGIGSPLDSRGDVLIEPAEMLSELSDLGFGKLEQAGEGQLKVRPTEEGVSPFFEGEYLGDVGVYEVTGVKK